MFELGTHKSRLWRSSKNEWFGGTAGFYWGCNNAKDLQVRLETVPALDGRPANVVFHPSDRDRTWLELFDRKNKTIDVNFGFLAFTTPPAVGLAFARCEIHDHGDGPRAQDLGEIRSAAWPYLGTDRYRAHAVHGDSPLSRQRLDRAARSFRRLPNQAATAKPVDLARIDVQSNNEPERINPPSWHGTILPESDADIWLAAAFADYERIVAREKAIRAHAGGGKLGIRDRERLALALFAPASRYLTAVARRGGHDLALSEIHADLRSDDGTTSRPEKGCSSWPSCGPSWADKPFDKFMDKFGRDNAGRPVSSAAFFEAAEKAHGKPLGDLKAAWLNGDALSKLGADVRARQASGRFWSVDSFERQLDKALIVYGTIAEADSQREAAQALRRKLASRWANITIPIKADNEVTDSMIKDSHILLVGRPATNRLSARLARALPVGFGTGFVHAGGRDLRPSP